MMYFCTLFDSNYISKGIALYLSIENYTEDFMLYVMAMDRKCEEQLIGMRFAHMKVDCIEDNMFKELVEAKNNRSRAEFCWTCGSVVTQIFLEKYRLPEITYLDSDLMFFNSPAIIHDELVDKNASVGLSPHFIHNTTFGIYCVQYVYFKRDENGIACLNWWKDECLKWCYSKLEDGKYGDQKYLDYMHQMFNGVVDIENRGAGIANWNMELYKYDFDNNMLIYNNIIFPIVFFHYNGLNVKYDGKKLELIHSKYFTNDVQKGFIMPYAKLLIDIYSNYLNIPVNEFEIKPHDAAKIFFNSIWVFIRGTFLSELVEDFYMRIKYAKRRSPYSER